MTNFVARRTTPQVDIWDLFADGTDIGCMTRFPGEGPMATVRLGEDQRTVAGATLHECLATARRTYTDLVTWSAQADEYIEDEDGELAYMRMLERRAEGPYGYEYHDEPAYF